MSGVTKIKIVLLVAACGFSELSISQDVTPSGPGLQRKPRIMYSTLEKTRGLQRVYKSRSIALQVPHRNWRFRYLSTISAIGDLSTTGSAMESSCTATAQLYCIRLCTNSMFSGMLRNLH
jgi:hypothetical protein